MTLKELNERVKILQDIEEIKQMHRNYLYGLSTCEWEKMADYFAENAEAYIARHDLPYEYDIAKGKENIRTMLKDGIGKRVATHRPRGGHLLIQPVISVQGDTAKGHWLMSRFTYATHLPGRFPPRLDKGRYDVEYVREDRQWKFRYLKWTCPWPEPEESI
jgi:hypothetical protein